MENSFKRYDYYFNNNTVPLCSLYSPRAFLYLIRYTYTSGGQLSPFHSALSSEVSKTLCPHRLKTETLYSDFAIKCVTGRQVLFVPAGAKALGMKSRPSGYTVTLFELLFS